MAGADRGATLISSSTRPQAGQPGSPGSSVHISQAGHWNRTPEPPAPGWSSGAGKSTRPAAASAAKYS